MIVANLSTELRIAAYVMVYRAGIENAFDIMELRYNDPYTWLGIKRKNELLMPIVFKSSHALCVYDTPIQFEYANPQFLDNIVGYINDTLASAT